MVRCLLYTTVVACVTAVFSTSGYSQVNTATLVGAVKDASGASIPSATITAKNTATGLSRTVKTDAAGNYVITTLQAGHIRSARPSPDSRLRRCRISNCRLHNRRL